MPQAALIEGPNSAVGGVRSRHLPPLVNCCRNSAWVSYFGPGLAVSACHEPKCPVTCPEKRRATPGNGRSRRESATPAGGNAMCQHGPRPRSMMRT
jgi:hypothetical protein